MALMALGAGAAACIVSLALGAGAAAFMAFIAFLAVGIVEVGAAKSACKMFVLTRLESKLLRAGA